MGNTTSANAALQRQIKRLNEFDGLAERAAPRVAAETTAIMRKNVIAEIAPSGKAWPRTKDGRKPLKDVVDRMKVRVLGTVVLFSLDGHYARHDLGAVKGKVRRPVLPKGSTPDPMVRAISKIVGDEFTRTMVGGRRG